jgi:hypothetical protein
MSARTSQIRTTALALVMSAGGPARAGVQEPPAPVGPAPASEAGAAVDPFAEPPSTVPAGALRTGPPGVVPPPGPPAPPAAAPQGPTAQAWETERPDAPEVRGKLRQGLRVRGNYVHLAPGIVAGDLRSPDRYHAWGIGVGRYFAGDSRLAGSFGGFFEHAWLYHHDPNRTPLLAAGHLIRFGPEARLGVSGERVFGYVLARFGVDVAVDRRGWDRRDIAALHTSLGVGFQVAPGPWRRLLLGVEPAVDLVFPAPLFLLRARLFAGLRF